MSSSNTDKVPDVAPTEDNPAPPPAIDGQAVTGAQSAGVKAAVQRENDQSPLPANEYPSGMKLALLMTSIFVGMFLVSLVCLLGPRCFACLLLP